MSRCRSLSTGLLATMLFVSMCNANMFLNGEYEKAARSVETHSNNPSANNIFFNHAIISRQASPFSGPTYLPPKEFIKCSNGQQCVRKSQCQSGYYSQNVPKIQNCDEDTDICCTYRPPAPPTTTQRPYVICGRDSDCVTPSDCKNGEIIAADYIKRQGASNQCYAPDTCCRMPSTTLTEDGYIFNLPETRFPLPTNPTVSEPRPTQPAYRPAQTTPAPYRPTQPAYRPAQTTPAPYRPQPAQTTPAPVYRPQPTQPAYQPQPTQPAYRPQPTQPAYRPQPTQPKNEYLPPKTTTVSRQPQPQQPRPQPSQPQQPRPQPTQPAYKPQPTQPAYKPQQTQPAYKPQQTQPAYKPQQTQPSYRPQPTQPAYRPQQTQPAYKPQQTQPAYRPTQQSYQPTTQRYRPQPGKPTNEYLPPITDNEIPDRIPQSSNAKPIYRGEDQLSPAIFPNSNGSPQKYFAKCASALVCSPENYCNALGVRLDSPVQLSANEAAFRVPMTDCLLPDTGAPGKCCRDANYVDPWPVNLAGVCASRNKNTKPQGIKDIDSNFAEIPWQAMVLKDSSKSLLCGGAIVGDEFVITTAQCVQGVPISDLKVKAGEWELGSTNEPLPFQLAGVKSVDIHPEYNPSTGSNNMAIIRLQKRLEFATHIQPICISDEDPSPNEQCVTTGWGKQALQIHEEGAIMHVTGTTPLSRADCGADATGVCSATQFDSCEFDSGSALACGTGSSVRLKGIYAVENACGEGQAVRFIKPDIKWINTAFANKNKPLLLKRF